MTLCLAWKNNNEIHFASDSRLTDKNKIAVTNDATKIFKIGVEIYGPIDSDNPNNSEKLIHRTNFGLCFTGSYLNGSLLADTMEEILTNIQGAPNYSDYSIENLTDIAFAVYKQVSIQLMEINGIDGLSEVLIGGYCPIENHFKLFKFSPNPIIAGQELSFQKTTINLESEIVFIGDKSAKTEAKKLIKKLGKNYSKFHLLRDIIKNNSISTVGGNIQAGLFSNCNFKTYGIVEYSLIENDYGNETVESKFKFRGLIIDFDDSELRKGFINIRKTFFNPFEHEREEYFKKIQDDLQSEIDKIN
jgi:hypothetical protein